MGSGLYMVFRQSKLKEKTMDKDEYFFYEWLIRGKKMTEEQFSEMSEKKIKELKEEYRIFKDSL